MNEKGYEEGKRRTGKKAMGGERKGEEKGNAEREENEGGRDRERRNMMRFVGKLKKV